MSTGNAESLSLLDSSLSFKIRKVVRYVWLDGISKTLGKVRAQYHLARTETFEGERWINPACRSPDHPSRFVGIIGSGRFAHAMVAHYLAKVDSKFLRSVYDNSRSRSLSLCRDYGGAYAAGDVEQIIADPKIKLVYIASNHASHAEYAIRCLNAGKSVHIEKPQVVSHEQLTRLLAAQAANPGAMVFLGFNRPLSPHFKRIKAIFDGQDGEYMFNWFIAGHAIPADNWYYSPAEGGRVLGNLCHWTDATLALIGLEKAFPIEIFPACERDSQSNYSVGLKFADGSLAAMTFSAKGQPFEGVRERLNAHRGDAIVNLVDFKEMTVEAGEKRSKFSSFHRDHGHQQNITNSYSAVKTGDRARAVSLAYNKATATLFLGVKAAIEEGRVLTVDMN